MPDNLNVIWQKFFQHRTRTLWERFPGHYRALVVETNDPLNIYRVRFKCPDMHDFSNAPDDCPWAVPNFDLGGKRAGRFSHPCIGDWVWITFERGHPYGPIWTGFAQPTRRKFYAYPSVFQVTPLSVNEDGRPADRPDDYDEDYLPKDGRPMAHGWVDRYGNLDIHSSVGFYPDEHKDPPPPPDHDALQKTAFDQKRVPPQVNSPDKKYMARVTKYGQQLVLSDQGFHWKKEDELGEFEGHFRNDEKFETRRWKALQKALNEGEPDGDHRRVMLMNRYGSRFEMRDTGWAQMGPVQSKSRPGEYGPPRVLSKETERDLRWAKIRTKGGWLMQAYDKGCDPAEDKFIKRPVNAELGTRSEREDLHWGDKDARWFRIIGRYGFKFVIDERGTDPKNADKREKPQGNGMLLKGRRSPSAKGNPKAGDPRGFHFEFNENDEANHATWASPMGNVVELNDRYQYLMIAATMGRKWTPKWQGLKENEFVGKPTMARDPERTSHHLKLDHDNEYVRLKTRGGKGPRPMTPANRSGVTAGELNQGVEFHDGDQGDGPWVEVVDCQHRGLFFSKRGELGVWRAKRGRKMYTYMDDKSRKIVIYNNEANGTIEIFCNQKVNVVSNKDVNISAGGSLSLRAGGQIRMQAGGTRLTLDGAGVHTNKNYYGDKLFAEVVGIKVNKGVLVKSGTPRPGGVTVAAIAAPVLPGLLEPQDRAKTYNAPFEECPRAEIEHPT